jgi:hypothetical protein
MARFQSSRRRATAPLGSLLLVLLGTASVSAFLFPAAPRACRTTPSPLTTATTTTTRLFSSVVDEAPAPAQQQEQPEAQEQEQQQQAPARRRPTSPRPSGPWVLLEGRQRGREGRKEYRREDGMGEI